MASPTVFDIETTIFKKGNPFAKRNKMCYVGAYPEGDALHIGTADFVQTVANILREASLLIGFNLKFDLHWMMRMGHSFQDKEVWDCQLAHFLLTKQQERYPSLEGVCAFYGLEGKDDNINNNYWSKGIDTPDIPPDEMIHYLGVDLVRTMQVYHKQLEHFKAYPKLYRLFRLQCKDLHVLQEMEWNGLKLNTEEARKKADETRKSIAEIESTLNSKVAGGLALNWDSGDDVSCFLYGGVITREVREIAGVYMSGQKVGQPRYKIRRETYELPRLTTPIDGSELKKAGYWSTDEKTLKQLKGVKPITSLLLERAKLSKLLDYFDGLPTLIEEMDWSDDMLHGQLNQCVAITGRLSATNPNQQNQPPEAKQLIVSRYD